MEKLSPLTFMQNMYNDRLRFKSKVDGINHLHLTTKQTYLEMCVGGKHTIIEKTELKFEKLWHKNRFFECTKIQYLL